MARPLFTLCLLVGMTLASAVGAQERFPSKPVRMLVPFAVGGGSDIAARILSARMTETLGQHIIVDNRGGASGKIGSEVAAKAAPDGYTLQIHI